MMCLSIIYRLVTRTGDFRDQLARIPRVTLQQARAAAGKLNKAIENPPKKDKT